MKRVLGTLAFVLSFSALGDGIDCPAGTYSGTGTDTPDACEPCDPGRYSSTPHSLLCLPCEPGAYQSLMGQTSCSLCEAGTFADATGSLSCAPCAEGTDSDEGAVECVAVSSADNGGGGCTLAALAMSGGGGSEPPRYDFLFLLATFGLFVVPFYSLYSKRAARIKV